MQEVQVAVLGGGPGGYTAAIRCAQYGLRTALIEGDALGGACLNRGCIPTKALLHGAELYHSMGEAAAFGIQTGPLSLDYAALAARKDKVVAKLRSGVASLEKAHGVAVISGYGRLLDPHRIQVGEEEIRAERIILATGSTPALPPIPGVEHALTSDGVLALAEAPDSLVIIGGGVIGMEFASLFAMLGKPVTVLEALDECLPGVDADILRQLKRRLKKLGVALRTGVRVEEIRPAGEGVQVRYAINGEAGLAEAACCAVCTGRRPNTAGIGLEEAGIPLDNGFVPVDEGMGTGVPGVYAIGDITGKAQLAHVATAQGMTAAANCAGKQARMDYSAVPACLYTSPELATVGLGEDALLAAGRPFRKGVYNLAGNGKAMVMGEALGLVKLLADPDSGRLLGAQLFGPRATDLIGELCAVMRCGGTVEQLCETIHPHPTLSEAVLEAAEDLLGLCCHKPPNTLT